MSKDATSKTGRRVIISLGVVVLLVAAGAVVYVRQTSWWTCGHDTDLRSDSELEFSVMPNDLPQNASDVVDQVSSLPGVAEFLGGALLGEGSASGVEITSGAGNDIVISDQPYNAPRSTFRDISLDPVTGTVSWDRGQPGRMAMPQLIGDDFVTFGAVRSDDYRLTSLDPTNGDVRGCVNIDRFFSEGIEETAETRSPDGSAIAVATPGNDGSALSRIDLESLNRTWTTDLESDTVAVTNWYGDVIAVGHVPPTTQDISALWQNRRTGDRISLTAVDAVTGDVRWTWPEQTGDDDPPRFGALVPTAETTVPLVVVVERTPGVDGDENRLIALDPETGDEVWSYDSPTEVSAIGDHLLISVGDQTGVLDAATGARLWSESNTPRNTAGEVDVEGPQMWGDQLLVGDELGGAMVIDPETGDRSGIIDFDLGFGISYWVTGAALTVTMDTPVGVYMLVFGRD